MNNTHINYQEYLESYAWKALKKTKLEEQPQCECCGAPATSVHHLSYERLWREKAEDIVSICERCHEECHHIWWYQIKNDEEILRKKFENLKIIKEREGIGNIFLNKKYPLEKWRIIHKNTSDVWIFDAINEQEQIENNLKNIVCRWNLKTDQTEAYNKIVDFIKDETIEVFILKWAAWTWKTTLLREIKDYFIKNNIKFFFGAPTGKATFILKEKLALKDKDTYWTIFSTLYKLKDKLDKKNKDVNYFEKQSLLEDYIYIIDESSLINFKSHLDNNLYQKDILNFWTGSLLRDILKAKAKNTKIIFVWDKYQLSPVSDSESLALDGHFIKNVFNLNFSEFELTEIKRQKWESWILDLSQKIRERIKKFDYKVPFLEENNDVKLINNQKQFLEVLSTKINHSIVISYTNKKVDEYNQYIRTDIKGFHDIVEIWDKLMISKNTFIDWEQLLNWEIVEVVTISGAENRISFAWKIQNELKFMKATVKKCFWDQIEFDVILLLNSFNIDNGSWEDITLQKFLFSDFLKRKLYSDDNSDWKWHVRTRKWDVDKYYQTIENIEEDNNEFHEIMKNDKYLNSLHIKYWYAMTCHKSQWSEWENVFIDIDDYHSEQVGIGSKVNKEFFKFLYTWITRWKSNVYILNSDILLEYWKYDDYSSKFWIEDDSINDLINHIWTILESYSYEVSKVYIEGVILKSYKVEFIFSNGTSKANITFDYSKKGFSWKAQIHQKDNIFSSNIKELLLKHNIIKDAY